MEADPDKLLFILQVEIIDISHEWLIVALLIAIFLLSTIVAISKKSTHDISIEESGESDTVALKNALENPIRLKVGTTLVLTFLNVFAVTLIFAVVSEQIKEGWLAEISGTLNTVIGSKNKLGLLLFTLIGSYFFLVLCNDLLPSRIVGNRATVWARKMALPINLILLLTHPLKPILSWLDSKLQSSESRRTSTSKEDKDKAIELTMSERKDPKQEADFIKGIVNFGDVTVKQIMKSRVDVVAIEIQSSFEDVLIQVKECGYSRIPVYSDDFDNIEGILYVKDLLRFREADKDIEWQSVVRKQVLFAPELKKIDDLLREFQKERMHIAIVVDEYGGSSGIVTLEDIVEEVIGEIKDEFDEEEEVEFIKLEEGNYIFEGKTLLNDVSRILGVDTSTFDEIKGEADSLAGLMLESLGHIPKLDEEVLYKKYRLKVVSVSDKRIEKVNVVILE